KEWRADTNARTGKPLREDREKRAGENGETGNEKEQIVEQEAGLARNKRVEMILAGQIIAILDVGREAHDQDDGHEADKPWTDLRVGEGMDRTDHAAPRKERAENTEQKRGEHQPNVPDLHHAAFFLHHDGVKESRACKPRQE